MNNTDHPYMQGFGNHFSSEALPGTLPEGQNSPQKVKHGLYAEQLNGSAFTAPRSQNLRSWLYRIRPSAVQEAYAPYEQPKLMSPSFANATTSPNQLRWKPLDFPNSPTHFIDSLTTYAGNGSPQSQSGCAIHLYAATKSMEDEYFYNADGELLIVPQKGALEILTEFGLLIVAPKEIVVIPRGVKFQVKLPVGKARGYICENFGAPFILPDLGPIGANGLANPRDFKTPTAQYQEKEGKFKVIAKFNGHMWSHKIGHSPLDVVAWHGNYAPYKYDLRLFNTINTVSFDHPDPSIFTVLTSPSGRTGMANIDFVIFPPRWMVSENTFRPPYYHRNIMSEYMGLIEGVYDAKEEGFLPGGGSLHNTMTPHGPDATTFDKASHAKLKPEQYNDTMAFMFESRYLFETTQFAMQDQNLDQDYLSCWQNLPKQFKKP